MEQYLTIILCLYLYNKLGFAEPHSSSTIGLVGVGVVVGLGLGLGCGWVRVGLDWGWVGVGSRQKN